MARRRKGNGEAEGSKRASASRGNARGRAKIGKVMREYKHGALRSSSGAKVRKRKQAVAIALSEARRSGARVPRRKAARRSRTTH